MAELTLAQKLGQVKATITEIKQNPQKNVCVVSVKLSDGVNEWYKPFGLSLDKGVIAFEDFKRTLQDTVRETYSRDKALAEINSNLNKEFILFDEKAVK